MSMLQIYSYRRRADTPKKEASCAMQIRSSSSALWVGQGSIWRVERQGSEESSSSAHLRGSCCALALQDSATPRNAICEQVVPQRMDGCRVPVTCVHMLRTCKHTMPISLSAPSSWQASLTPSFGNFPRKAWGGSDLYGVGEERRSMRHRRSAGIPACTSSGRV